MKCIDFKLEFYNVDSLSLVDLDRRWIDCGIVGVWIYFYYIYYYYRLSVGGGVSKG